MRWAAQGRLLRIRKGEVDPLRGGDLAGALPRLGDPRIGAGVELCARLEGERTRGCQRDGRIVAERAARPDAGWRCEIEPPDLPPGIGDTDPQPGHHGVEIVRARAPGGLDASDETVGKRYPRHAPAPV